LTTTPSILLGVVIALSALHMVAPDHWVPLTVTSHRNQLTRSRTYLLAFTIGLGHGVSSAALSLVIALVGSLFFPAYYVTLFAVVILLVIAFYILVKAARESKAGTKVGSVSMVVSVIPDPALVPFILVANGFGAAYTFAVLAGFIVAAVASLVLVTFLATMGLSRALSKVRPQYVDYLVALALVMVAVFIYLYG
jgi:hypothetical protein